MHNTLLLAHQAPAAASPQPAWPAFAPGRCVRTGEKGLYIFAPMQLNLRADATQAARGKREGDEELTRVLYRTGAVFDVSQTDPIEAKSPCRSVVVVRVRDHRSIELVDPPLVGQPAQRRESLPASAYGTPSSVDGHILAVRRADVGGLPCDRVPRQHGRSSENQ